MKVNNGVIVFYGGEDDDELYSVDESTSLIVD